VAAHAVAALAPWRGLRRDRRESDMSALSADLGLHHTYVPHESTFDEFGSMLTGHVLSLGATCLRSDSTFSVSDDHDVLASIQNSSWGGRFFWPPFLRGSLIISFCFPFSCSDDARGGGRGAKGTLIPQTTHPILLCRPRSRFLPSLFFPPESPDNQ
jgi:hypothetical protein